MSRWVMLHDDGRHHRMDEGLYLHYPDTCNVHAATVVSSADSPWAPRLTRMDEIRLAPSHLGWVAVCYETKGVMTFFVQLNETRAAWQRIEWPTGFDENWDDKRVQEAIANFISVAKREDAREPLPKP
jgi:hypothetical protein